MYIILYHVRMYNKDLHSGGSPFYLLHKWLLTAEHTLPLLPLQVECGYPPQAHVFLLTSNTVSPCPQVDGECGVLCMSSLLGLKPTFIQTTVCHLLTNQTLQT